MESENSLHDRDQEYIMNIVRNNKKTEELLVSQINVVTEELNDLESSLFRPSNLLQGVLDLWIEGCLKLLDTQKSKVCSVIEMEENGKIQNIGSGADDVQSSNEFDSNKFETKTISKDLTDNYITSSPKKEEGSHENKENMLDRMDTLPLLSPDEMTGEDYYTDSYGYFAVHEEILRDNVLIRSY